MKLGTSILKQRRPYAATALLQYCQRFLDVGPRNEQKIFRIGARHASGSSWSYPAENLKAARRILIGCDSAFDFFAQASAALPEDVSRAVNDGINEQVSKGDIAHARTF